MRVTSIPLAIRPRGRASSSAGPGSRPANPAGTRGAIVPRDDRAKAATDRERILLRQGTPDDAPDIVFAQRRRIEAGRERHHTASCDLAETAQSDRSV